MTDVPTTRLPTTSGSQRFTISQLFGRRASLQSTLSQPPDHKELLGRFSKPTYPFGDESDDGIIHNSCCKRVCDSQYPRSSCFASFAQRTNLARRVAHSWCVLGKPTYSSASQSEDIDQFSTDCEEIALEDAEHIRCLLLRTDAEAFEGLMDFIPAACECDCDQARYTRLREATLVDSLSLLTAHKGSMTSVDSMSFLPMPAAANSQPTLAPVKEAPAVVPPTGRRSVLSLLSKKNSIKPQSTDASDKVLDPMSINALTSATQSTHSSSPSTVKKLWGRSASRTMLHSQSPTGKSKGKS